MAEISISVALQGLVPVLAAALVLKYVLNAHTNTVRQEHESHAAFDR